MKPGLAAYFLAVAGIILQGLFIKIEHDEKYTLADIMKGSASLMFVIIGLLALKNPDCSPAFLRLIVIGLVCGMIGDILLNLRFVFAEQGQKIFLAGIAVFLAGHILYLVALIPYASHLAVAVIIGAALAAGLLYYIFKTMEVKKAFKIFGVVYLGAVIIMTCLAIDGAIMGGTSAWIFAVGAVLFTLSDIVLIFNTFSGVTKFSLRITNLSLYYLGQLLIALSLYYPR